MNAEERIRSLAHSLRRELHELKVFGRPSQLRYETILSRLEDIVRLAEEWANAERKRVDDEGRIVLEDILHDRCSRHPRYQAKRPPTADCWPCRWMHIQRRRGSKPGTSDCLCFLRSDGSVERCGAHHEGSGGAAPTRARIRGASSTTSKSMKGLGKRAPRRGG